jgi:hypothetical protein
MTTATLVHLLTVLVVTLLNNLGPLLVAGLVAYALAALHRAIPGLVALADRALGLHLSAAREAALASSVDRAVYAVQGRVAIPADRREAVARDVAGRFPGLDPDHLDTLIDAAISGAKLQHGTDAWRAPAPTTPAADAPHDPSDVTALVRDAFQAGQQAILSALATVQAQALAGATAPSAPPVAPTPTPLPAGTVATPPVGDDGTGAPVNVVSVSGTLHTADDGPVHLQGVITPVATPATPVATAATS